ncbi:tRNA (adenosine(37)-N6)-threonylcarbamoyltransferase complex ATPase subunit type 1 TsaE [Candidatus Symbiobacter mobilis]|uniref:tRNA threonylcarbamoyladenosine biosynthesis protein TsaE n=1 Tax=Candidatus Symbiobacter mobilis CR TaxID=946483 RepID=U5N7N3_9BURK|nr:ATPase-like protein [Candidatus Symbiobacter mobilis CR]
MRIPSSPLPPSCTLHWPDENATQRFAVALAGCEALRTATVHLFGGLGAGKTTLARHLLRALGVRGAIKSPSYAVVEPYEVGDLRAWHFDFYRCSDPAEWEDAGLRELLAAPGLHLVEWPQHAALPLPDLAIDIEALDADARQATLRAYTPLGLTLRAAAAPGNSAPP